jgi:hypothetical protein
VPRNVAESWHQRENWQFETHTVVFTQQGLWILQDGAGEYLQHGAMRR